MRSQDNRLLLSGCFLWNLLAEFEPHVHEIDGEAAVGIGQVASKIAKQLVAIGA